MDVVSRIIETMDEKQINGVQLAKILGKKKSPVTDWKNGVSKPTLEQVIIICEKFAISSDYLLFGCGSHVTSPNSNILNFNSTSQKIDYKNKVLHLKDDSFFVRFKEARETAGVSLEDAASGAFLSVDTLRILEDDDIPMLEIDARMKQVQEIGWDQLSYLAYKYDVDLYWLLCGKVRPPAAVVQNGQLVYPPYEFMMEASQQPKEDSPKSDTPKSSTPRLTAKELAQRFENVFGKKQPSSDPDFDNVYPTDPEYDMQISWAAFGGAHLDHEKNEAMQKMLRLHEKRGRLINEEMERQKKEPEEK